MGSGSFPFFSEQWLVDSGQKDAGKFYSNKSEKVLIKLFQKFAEFEAEPHFNARASALATALQNREANLPQANIFSILDRVNPSRM